MPTEVHAAIASAIRLRACLERHGIDGEPVRLSCRPLAEQYPPPPGSGTGERLRWARLRTGMLQRELARAASRAGYGSVGVETISKHETCSYALGRKHADACAQALGVSVAWLLFGEGEP